MAVVGKPTLVCEDSTNEVTLTFPVPIIGDDGSLKYDNTSSNKTTSITFCWCSNDKNKIVAACDTEGVIEELFPGDTGEEEESTATNKDQRTYQWCNYLGGIYLGAVSSSSGGNTAATASLKPTLPSTKAILQQLMRRVRAATTLGHILQCLNRNKSTIPLHPCLEEEWPAHIQLRSWTALQEPDAEPTLRTYQATLKNSQNGQQMTAKVHINAARYPSVPPQWDLVKDTELYDESLANIQKAVNTHSIQDLVDPSNDATFEWILTHQLWELARHL
ncbi:MAG: hypothetical protein SGARI_006918 [Bacillariaceae sp.]